MTTNNDDLVYKYYSEIADYKPLSRDEELRFIKLAQDGDIDAYETIIKSNLKFVIKIAKMFRNQGHPLNDLINEGNLGLINAISRFDLESKNKFITYAVWWIRQGINNAINETGKSVRLPVNILVKIKNNKKFVDDYIATNHVAPMIGEVLSNGEEVNKYLLPDAHTTLSLDETINDSNITYGDALTVETNEMTMDDVMVKDEIITLLNDLNDREKDIVIKYFGLDGTDKMTLLEISEIYGLTIERVRQIKEKSIRKMRHNSSRLYQLIKGI